MKNQLKAEALRKQGVNPNQYVSLGDLQTVLSSILDNHSNSQSKISYMPFAKKSKFYNQIMSDGNIFNPYLHRRFLPVQYLKMMNYRRGRRTLGYNACLRECYSFQYSIDYTRKEAKKIAFLEWNDPRSFYERSKFFSIEKIKLIIDDYVKKAILHIENLPTKNIQDVTVKIIKGRGRVEIGSSLEELIDDLKAFSRQVNRCNNYKKLSQTLESFDYVVLPYETRKSKDFIDVFKGAGAYYTIKHLIMFEGCSFKGAFESNATNKLKSFLRQELEGYVYHAMLKELLDDNYIDIKKVLYNKNDNS